MAVYLQTVEEQNQEFHAGLELESDMVTHADDGGNSNTYEKDCFETLVGKVENEVACKPSINSEREDGKFQLKLTPSLSRSYDIKINVNEEKTATNNFLVRDKERQFEVVGKLDLQGEKLKGPSGIAVNSKGEIAVTDFDGHFSQYLTKMESALIQLVIMETTLES